MGKGYFEVDKKGLAKLLEEKGKQFAVYELIQNAWDTSAKKVDITFKKIPGRPLARIVVTDDDPDGFIDLTHSFTLFAESVGIGGVDEGHGVLQRGWHAARVESEGLPHQIRIGLHWIHQDESAGVCRCRGDGAHADPPRGRGDALQWGATRAPREGR
jgi:hypothetical protein